MNNKIDTTMNYKLSELTADQIGNILNENLDRLTDDEAFRLMQRYNELVPLVPNDAYSEIQLMDKINVTYLEEDN